jgi:copper chaperone
MTMRDVALIAADISCEHCQRTIEAGFATSPGVSRVEVDIPTKTVHLQYDEEVTDEDALKAELDELGYPVHSG